MNFLRRPAGLAALGVLLLLLVSTVYWPGLSGGFIFDDHANIVDNPKVHATSINLESLERAAGGFEAGTYGRPLATVSFAIDHAIGGLDPRGFKRSSLLAHLLNALLVLALVRLVLGRVAALAPWKNIGAFAVALLWAAHPLQVSAVLYVVQRMEILSLTFVLLALMAYVHGRTRQIEGRSGWGWIIGSALLAGIGMLGKETAILFPVFALGLELTLLQFRATDPRSTRTLKWGYIAGGALAILVLVAFVAPHYLSSGDYGIRGFTMSQRLLTQLTILPMYIGQVLLPLPGSMPFYYDDLQPAASLLQPISTLIGLIVIVALLASATLLRRRAPLYALGIFWFFGAHLLTSNVIPLELAFEHRNYFASLGIVLSAADLIRRIPMRDGPALKYVGVAAICVGFMVLTMIRSATWGEPFLLATELVHRNPMSPRASNDLATIYMEMADNNVGSPFYQFGQREFERGSRLPNASIIPEQGLILMAAGTGDSVKPEWWDRLIEKLRTQPITPEIPVALFNMLDNRNRGLLVDDARLVEAFTIMLSRVELPPYSYAQVGDYVLRSTGDQALADRLFMRAIERSEDYPDYADQIIETLIRQGHIRQAGAALEHATALGIVDPGKYKEAIKRPPGAGLGLLLP